MFQPKFVDNVYLFLYFQCTFFPITVVFLQGNQSEAMIMPCHLTPQEPAVSLRVTLQIERKNLALPRWDAIRGSLRYAHYIP
jgi:hypothetical protein